MKSYNCKNKMNKVNLMIIFSKFVCNSGTVSEALRSVNVPSHLQPRNDLLRFSTNYRPLVVWNLTKKCNLKCQHCYIEAGTTREDEELSTDQAKSFLKDITAMGVPIVLFSGGEPLIRLDFKELVSYARSIGLRVGISTNGTLINQEMAEFLANQQISYVGISLDAASPEVHEKFRGVKGSYQRALDGLLNCKNVGLKTGVRITVTKDNYKDLPILYKQVRKLEIPRFCVYYLVPSGRGKNIMNLDLNPEQRTEVFNFLYSTTLKEGPQPDIEILTTDSPQDGALLIEKLKKSGRSTEELQRLFKISGGCSAGEKIANVDHFGDVHLCQFWTDLSLGNVKKQPFSKIWNDSIDPLVLQLREKEKHLNGKCGICDYKSMCKGCRLRARYHHGDIFGTDPSCLYSPPITS
jgi:radical SAM protein with 4Fe4S-binding SPASM domain